MTGWAGQFGWLVPGEESKEKCLLCLPERGKTTLCNLSNLKLLAGPQCPKQEPLALTEHSWRAWSGKCWWLPGALSGAVPLVLCVLYCWIGRERCVLKRHYNICRLKCSQALIFMSARRDFSYMFSQDIVHQVALESSADVSSDSWLLQSFGSSWGRWQAWGVDKLSLGHQGGAEVVSFANTVQGIRCAEKRRHLTYLCENRNCGRPSTTVVAADNVCVCLFSVFRALPISRRVLICLFLWRALLSINFNKDGVS